MKVKDLINMLENHNLNAELIFLENDKFISINSTEDCKCKEKRIFINVPIYKICKC